MKKVLGYYYKKLNKEFLENQDIKSNELIGTTIQLCSAIVISDKTLIKDNDESDIIRKMVSENIGTIEKFDEDNFIAEVMFVNPMPENVFFEYYGKDEQPIY